MPVHELVESLAEVPGEECVPAADVGQRELVLVTRLLNKHERDTIDNVFSTTGNHKKKKKNGVKMP